MQPLEIRKGLRGQTMWAGIWTAHRPQRRPQQRSAVHAVWTFRPQTAAEACKFCAREPGLRPNKTWPEANANMNWVFSCLHHQQTWTPQRHHYMMPLCGSAGGWNAHKRSSTQCTSQSAQTHIELQTMASPSKCTCTLQKHSGGHENTLDWNPECPVWEHTWPLLPWKKTHPVMVLIPFLDQSLEAVAQQQQNTQMQTTFNKLFPQKKTIKTIVRTIVETISNLKRIFRLFFWRPHHRRFWKHLTSKVSSFWMSSFSCKLKLSKQQSLSPKNWRAFSCWSSGLKAGNSASGHG